MRPIGLGYMDTLDNLFRESLATPTAIFPEIVNENWTAVDNVMAKIIRLIFLAHPVQLQRRLMLIIFTAQCYAECGYAIGMRSRPSVCPSIGDVQVGYQDHVGWNSLKIITA